MPLFPPKRGTFAKRCVRCGTLHWENEWCKCATAEEIIKASGWKGLMPEPKRDEENDSRGAGCSVSFRIICGEGR